MIRKKLTYVCDGTFKVIYKLIKHSIGLRFPFSSCIGQCMCTCMDKEMYIIVYT